MSIQITTAFVQQFRGNVDHLVQQKGARLRPAVRVEPINGQYSYFDQIGSTAAQLRTTRHGDSPVVNTPHARRRVTTATYEWGDLIDRPDLVRTLIDPTSAYAQAASFALGRGIDDVIIAAANGTAYTGVSGGTSTALPSGQKVAVGTTGLTITKLMSAKEILDAAENDPDEPRFVALKAADVTTLLQTTEIKSADYNTVRALVQGQIDTFLGFRFIRTERLGNNAAGANRCCLAWRRNGILLGIGMEPKTEIAPRADKSFSTYVYAAMDLGATRMEEEAVVEISVTP